MLASSVSIDSAGLSVSDFFSLGFFDFLVFIGGTFIYMRMAFFILAGAALMISVISAIIRELVIRGIELREEVDLTV